MSKSEFVCEFMFLEECIEIMEIKFKEVGGMGSVIVRYILMEEFLGVLNGDYSLDVGMEDFKFRDNILLVELNRLCQENECLYIENEEMRRIYGNFIEVKVL